MGLLMSWVGVLANFSRILEKLAGAGILCLCPGSVFCLFFPRNWRGTYGFAYDDDNDTKK